MLKISVFLLIAYFSVTEVIDLSGDITPTSTDVGKTYKLTAAATATLTDVSVYTFDVQGGIVDLSGQGKVLSIDNDCPACGNTPRYLVHVIGPETDFTMNKTTLNFLNRGIGGIYAQSSYKLVIEECQLSGSPFVFAHVYDQLQFTIKNCTFKNSVYGYWAQNNAPHPFLGFLFTVKKCNKFYISNSLFEGINAGVYSALDANQGAYSAPIFLEGGTLAQIYKTNFSNCHGFLAGAVFAYKPGAQVSFEDVNFLKNTQTLPSDELETVLGSLSGTTEFLEEAGNESLGNDITRIGGYKLSFDNVCSDSESPHHRDGTKESSFALCNPPKGPKKPADLTGLWVFLGIFFGSPIVLVGFALIVTRLVRGKNWLRPRYGYGSRGGYITQSEAPTTTTVVMTQQPQGAYVQQPGAGPQGYPQAYPQQTFNPAYPQDQGQAYAAYPADQGQSYPAYTADQGQSYPAYTADQGQSYPAYTAGQGEVPAAPPA